MKHIRCEEDCVAAQCNGAGYFWSLDTVGHFLSRKWNPLSQGLSYMWT